jgi:hypothetical protein
MIDKRLFQSAHSSGKAASRKITVDGLKPGVALKMAPELPQSAASMSSMQE